MKATTKKWIWIAAAALVVLVALGAVLAAASSREKAPEAMEEIEQIGEKYREEQSGGEGGEAAATVNGTPISSSLVERTYELQLAFYNVNKEKYGDVGEAPTEEAVLQSLIETEALVQEAGRRGLTADEKQVEEYFKAVDEAKQASEGSGEAEQALRAYLDGLGMDLETYREQIEKPLAKQQLSIENLAAAVQEEGTDWATFKQRVLEEAQIVYP